MCVCQARFRDSDDLEIDLRIWWIARLRARHYPILRFAHVYKSNKHVYVFMHQSTLNF